MREPAAAGQVQRGQLLQRRQRGQARRGQLAQVAQAEHPQARQRRQPRDACTAPSALRSHCLSNLSEMP